MQKKTYTCRSFMSALTFLCLSLFLFQCTNDEFLVEPTIPAEDQTISAASTTGCGCTYTVPVSTNTITVDGTKLGIKPGGIICLQGGATYKNIIFKNIRGTAAAPIIIKNCNGTATFNATGTYFAI